MQAFQKKYIPNWLTIMRMVMVPAIIVLFICDSWPQHVHGLSPYIATFKIDGEQYGFTVLFLIAGILFVIASFTDFLDGYLSRKYHWVSDWGKIWDPIADKTLVNSTAICLAYEGIIPFWIVCIFIMRDVIVDAYRMTAVKKGIDVAANKWGKIKTITQMIGIIIVFFLFNAKGMLIYSGTAQIFELSSSIFTWQYWTIQNGMIIIACFFSLFSGVIYIKDFGKSNKIKNGKN